MAIHLTYLANPDSEKLNLLEVSEGSPALLLYDGSWEKILRKKCFEKPGQRKVL